MTETFFKNFGAGVRVIPILYMMTKYNSSTASHVRGINTCQPATSAGLGSKAWADKYLEEPKGDSGSRMICLCEKVTSGTALRVIHELLGYEAADPGVPIHMQIYSPGGCVISGLAIIDVMKHITSPVFTYAIGYAASMGAVILACGEKDHRYILPHSRVMIHQASGGAGGTMDNVRATLAYHSELEAECEAMLAAATGRDIEQIRASSRVDNWLRAQSAIEFGLVDHVLEAAPHVTLVGQD